ncbi:hypothetical protein T11_9279 [Trichinella zimbabwensis]|uniref:Uncharacterized protein n=1 Tax=Trichinella zimbabwensis TaxID=268475 RepID=A0A0V1GCB2_9BILA|nr:hypothetical protein T11_9279 [Trichinella zimbabwensis]
MENSKKQEKDKVEFFGRKGLLSEQKTAELRNSTRSYEKCRSFSWEYGTVPYKK